LIFKKYSNEFVQLICALIFVFNDNSKKNALEAFTFAYTQINKVKRTWIVEMNNILSIDREEFRRIFEIYIDIVSSFTTQFFSETESKLKQLSKIYDENVQNVYLETLIPKDNSSVKKANFLKINDVFDKYYIELSDSSEIRDKLTEIFYKMYDKKTRTYFGDNIQKEEVSVPIHEFANTDHVNQIIDYKSPTVSFKFQKNN
jgi:hypothetical protein